MDSIVISGRITARRAFEVPDIIAMQPMAQLESEMATHQAKGHAISCGLKFLRLIEFEGNKAICRIFTFAFSIYVVDL